ncbi:MAG: methionine--tRNA ligase [Candidatus Staskawiczbacteria bacterium]|nr:methionine--tRNA ligase [Candidatus Staskawiczbacteria bacterium]
MFKKKNKFYITTTLPYVNADPHIGFALEIIQADVIARYHKSLGEEVFFNTGVDEHGLKIFQKAEENKLTPQEYCNIYAKKFDNLKQALNLSYNNFVRTTDLHHIEAAQTFWKLCEKNGDIYKKIYKSKYCVGCELEKTDSELVNGRCPIHPNLEVEIIDEENYFFRYSKYQKDLLKLYKKNPEFVVPNSKLNEIAMFTERGLEDFSISRIKEKMPWGIEVPGDSKQVMYVWFDALVNYVSALGWPEDKKKFKDFWPGLQIAGKDNLRQQSSMWQAMLLSAGLPTSKQIFIHGFVTANGQKMSKSLGNVINPFELVKKYSTDAVRYYLLREFSPTEDGDFTYEKFEQRYNADLAGGIGNLVARTLGIAKSETRSTKLEIRNKELKKKIKEVQKNFKFQISNFKFNEALASVWEIIAFCDKYINEEKLWETRNPQVINDLFFAIKEIGILLDPFLPETSAKIIKAVESKKSENLFPRIDKVK